MTYPEAGDNHLLVHAVSQQLYFACKRVLNTESAKVLFRQTRPLDSGQQKSSKLVVSLTHHHSKCKEDIAQYCERMVIPSCKSFLDNDASTVIAIQQSSWTQDRSPAPANMSFAAPESESQTSSSIMDNLRFTSSSMVRSGHQHQMAAVSRDGRMQILSQVLTACNVQLLCII